ncbi:MAG TPA: ATP-binding protein [Solirubrobacteraceae bacterium]|nr:ATP-binding protein [Solirubrobacteraceae bacterium]
MRTDVIPGLEELADPAADPADLMAVADRHSRRLRGELERSEGGSALLGVDLADPACSTDREWLRGHLHDTALQILEFIAGDGFGTGLPAPKIAQLAGGAARDLHDWVESEQSAVEPELLPELELITRQAGTLHPRVELEVGTIGASPTSEQVEALTGAVREAVNNARKHANASHVIVHVECDDDGRTAITVTDDGTGIDHEQVRSAGGLGVKGSIVGRMNRIGGHASLQDAPGGGTRVTLVSPRPRS